MEMTKTYKKLKKLCPGDKYPTQQRILDNARIPGTCQWFLNHETTQAWLNGDGHHILWLRGPSRCFDSYIVAHANKSQVQVGKHFSGTAQKHTS